MIDMIVRRLLPVAAAVAFTGAVSSQSGLAAHADTAGGTGQVACSVGVPANTAPGVYRNTCANGVTASILVVDPAQIHNSPAASDNTAPAGETVVCSVETPPNPAPGIYTHTCANGMTASVDVVDPSTVHSGPSIVNTRPSGQANTHAHLRRQRTHASRHRTAHHKGRQGYRYS